jgi:cephalosporin hydroxylase/glycosyltransferase involved in cell wall biosynthesis
MDSHLDTRKLIQEFHHLYYRGPDGAPPWKRIHFLGVETVKCPLDLWIYQEILFRTRPEVIVECGVHRGGTTLYLASMCDLLGDGEIVACDLSLRLVDPRVANHPRVKLFEGSSIDPSVHAAIASRCQGRRTMVILDSDHVAAHVLRELKLYGPLVTQGCYLICEDTNINGHPVFPEFGLGPFEAVAQFLAEETGWQVDSECEKLLLTFNPAGYLLRVDPQFATAKIERPDARDQAKTALASIIIPCFGELEFTRQCIDALVEHTRSPWELIVVDNGSTDGTAEYLAGLALSKPTRVEVISNASNLGFPAACNQGLKAARGDYLVLLNNDAIVTHDWLDQLIALAECDPTIGMTGPMSNYVSPPQLVEHAPYFDMESMHRFASRWRVEHRGQWLNAPKLSGFCLLMKRSAFALLGGLDERYGLGLFDDDDLALRARQAGLKLAVARDLFVHHFGSRTFQAAGIDQEALLAENQARFQSKWGLAETKGQTVNLRPWSPSRRETRRPRVSLTMIVRNEENNLPACLESARDLFDEIVVVDTGSTDRTVEIARSFGARVFDFVWVDDFAAARNTALARATGDYAFWLDADDVIDPPQRERLKLLLQSLTLANEAAFVVRCACDPDGSGGGGETVVDHIRLFPLRGDVRWTYRVHEQILPSLRQVQVPVRWSDVTVRHTGYTDAALRRRKLDRDAKILGEELEDRPSDPFVLFNLGSIAIERQDWRSALSYLSRSLAGSAPTDSITHKLHALIARSHQALGEMEAALTACAKGLALCPDDAELLFREAVIRRNIGDVNGAESCWRRILTLDRPERFSSVDQGIYGHLTRRNLAALAQERGDSATAVRLWSEVLAECPNDREVQARLSALAP